LIGQGHLVSQRVAEKAEANVIFPDAMLFLDILLEPLAGDLLRQRGEARAVRQLQAHRQVGGAQLQLEGALACSDETL